MKFSAIVPTYNDPQLAKCLDALDKLGPAEVIVVDSSAQPQPMPSLQSPLKVIRSESRLFPGAARNLGAKKAQFEWILFVDADVELNESPLLEKELSPDEIRFGAYQETASGLSLSENLQNRVLNYRFSEAEKVARIQQKSFFLQTSHFFLAKKAFESIGGFAETIRMREDVLFCLIAHKQKFRLTLDSDFVGIHHKKFHILSLLKDYFFRSFAAAYIDQRTEALKEAPHQVPLNLSLSWLLPLAGFLTASLPPIPTLTTFPLVLISFLLPVFLLPKLFLRRSFWDSFPVLLVELLTWPFLGAAAIAGRALGITLGTLGIRFSSLVRNRQTPLNAS